MADGATERIARRIARAGVCSRREAEALISAGRVAVNGVTIESPALNVSPKDRITVDGAQLPKIQAPRLWRFHKRKGFITTNRDPQGRPTVFDDLPPEFPRVVTVGRLDFNTEGLLLLTNDGGLARTLELPTTGWIRRYRARVHGEVSEDALKALARGSTVSGITYGPVEATLERQTGTNAWLAISLAEGKNREVRRLLDHLGLKVTRLIRISYGPFQLGNLKPGAVDEVPAKAIGEQLGSRMPDAAPDAKAPRAKARGKGRVSARAKTPRATPGNTERKFKPRKGNAGAHRRRPS
jgi:23S rRNA pseudouridine2605 synthase